MNGIGGDVARDEREASGLPRYTHSRRRADLGIHLALREFSAHARSKLRRTACLDPPSLALRRWLAFPGLLQQRVRWIVMPCTRVLWKRSTKRKWEASKRTGLPNCIVSL